ncbi:phosphoribulokinase [Nocardia sp. CA-128927]|uniref:phosphoribulokinase n=1 Tax=Nocardia sp. CA-128927 TaxID=3239975 RepID=UPI003D97D2A4
MADKTLRIFRASRNTRRRPIMLAIAGDSAAGKTTVTAGLVEALGAHRCVWLSTDDYHRFDRIERQDKPFTPLHPDCHYIDILGQHLQLLATGQPILKPVYDHDTGRLTRPELIEPNEFVIVEGLLPMHSNLARACFDLTVYLDPSEEIRRGWKVKRDTATRGYTAEQVLSVLSRSEPESTEFIRPQRAHADIVVRFAAIESRPCPPGTPLSAELLLRPTIQQPDLTAILQPELTQAIHLRLARDTDGKPVDSVHIHGYASTEDGAAVEKLIWHALGDPAVPPPESLGRVGPDEHSTPLAVVQTVLLHHLLA